MKSYVSALVVDGETATPLPVNDELLAIAADANRLTEENLDGLAASKLALDAVHRLLVDAIETTQTVVVDYRDVTSTGSTQALPDATGAPWYHVVETYGGALYLTLQVIMEDATNKLNNYVWVAIAVDGEIVARSSDQEAQCYADTWHAHAVVPLGAGSHTVELLFGVCLPDIAGATGGGPPTAGGDLQFADRTFIAMERLQ